MRRILIDGRFIGVGESMARYTLEILKGILELDQENEYTLLARPLAKSQISKFKSQNGNAKLKIVYLNIPHYSTGEQIRLLNYLNKENFDLVHFIQFNHPVLYKKPFVVTVHDLTLADYLNQFNPIKRLAFNKVMRSAIFASKKILTVSEFSKQDIIKRFKVDQTKIVVTYNGVDQQKYNSNLKSQISKLRDFKEKYGIGRSYLLYTGAWKKHKNLIRLLRAYEKFLNKSKIQNPKSKIKEEELLQLALVGKIDEKEPEVTAEMDRINKSLTTSYHLPAAIITTGYIDEDDLPVAYAGALAYVIPSLSEGFGLPPLEAMACGTPVISSNVSCMPEVLADAASYFDPYNTDDIAKAIERIATDEKLRADLIEKGLKQAKKYSWQKTAQETLEVYRSLF